MLPKPMRNVIAETSIVGMMMRDAQYLRQIAEKPFPTVLFTDVANKQIYEALLVLHEQGRVVNLCTIGEKLKDSEFSRDLQAAAYLIEVWDNAPVVGDIFDHVKRLNECHVRREAWEDCLRWQKALEHPGTDVFAQLIEIEQKTTQHVGTLLAHSEKEGEDNTYKKFPMEVFPEGLQKFLETAAESFPVDPGMMFLPAMVTFASCMGVGRVVECKKGWYEPPVLWGALIGEPSSLKTPATKAILCPLGEIDRELHEENMSLEKLHGQEVAKWRIDGQGKKGKEALDHLRNEPAPPTENCLMVDDITLESIAMTASQNPKGLVLYRNELGSWLRSFGKYSKGAGDSGEMNAYCDYWDCIAGKVQRKHGNPKTVYVPNKAMSIFGTIPPETLAGCASDDKFESGFFGRMLFTMPPRRLEKWTNVFIDPDDMQGWVDLCRTAYYDNPGVLERNRWRPKIVPMTEGAKKHWQEWYDAWGQRLYASQGEVLFGLAKLKGYAGRLALLFAGFDFYWTQKREMMVNQTHVKNSILCIEWFAREMTRVYRMVTMPKQLRKEKRLEDWIGERGGEITPRKLMQSNPTAYPEAEDAMAALEKLVKCGKGRWENRRHESGLGASSKVFKLSGRNGHPQGTN